MGQAYEQLLRKSRDAKRGGAASWGVQSRGEKVAVALVLNRPDWLAQMDYTLAEAIERLEGDWLTAVPLVAKALADEDLAYADAQQQEQDSP